MCVPDDFFTLLRKSFAKVVTTLMLCIQHFIFAFLISEIKRKERERERRYGLKNTNIHRYLTEKYVKIFEVKIHITINKCERISFL